LKGGPNMHIRCVDHQTNLCTVHWVGQQRSFGDGALSSLYRRQEGGGVFHSIFTRLPAFQQVCERLQQPCRPLNEPAVKVDQPEKPLQLLDIGWRRMALQGLHMGLERPGSFGCHLVT
jgi:hypothetical protein